MARAHDRGSAEVRVRQPAFTVVGLDGRLSREARSAGTLIPEKILRPKELRQMPAYEVRSTLKTPSFKLPDEDRPRRNVATIDIAR